MNLTVITSAVPTEAALGNEKGARLVVRIGLGDRVLDEGFYGLVRLGDKLR
jgi:hypothetical protein